MTTKEKIIKYIDFKGLSQGYFCRKINVSNGFLTSGKHIGSEKLKDIRDNYVDLNMNWLIYDEGEMIVSDVSTVNEDQDIYKKTGTVEHLKALLQSKDETIEAQKETIAILKDRLGMANKSKVG